MTATRIRFPDTSLLALVAVLAACAGPARDAGLDPVAPLRVQGEGYEGVILPAEGGEGAAEAAEGTWVPTSDQVREAEHLLAAYVRSEGEEDLWRRLPDYYRQYLGTIHDGRRCIYLNFVLRARWNGDVGEGFDGDRQLLIVFDGGDAYLQAEFDVEAGRFLWFGVNGEA